MFATHPPKSRHNDPRFLKKQKTKNDEEAMKELLEHVTVDVVEIHVDERLIMG